LHYVGPRATFESDTKVYAKRQRRSGCVCVCVCVCCSDQFDPFNRQPLTMDMLQPATELKQQIDSWLADNRKRKD